MHALLLLPLLLAAPDLVDRWAARDLPDWPHRAKGTAPRIVLARLEAGVEIDRVNEYLLGATPWSQPGSSWAGHHGDYDFTAVTLTSALYLHHDKLSDAAREHLVHHLLTIDGAGPRMHAPKSFGTVGETENHLLMTESSRYLKNQWLGAQHKPLERWLIGFLRSLRDDGFEEFNSIPYQGYAMQGLLNLEAFAADDRVRDAARQVLDRLAREYDVSSYKGRRCVPFRRQLKQHDNTSLIGDDLTTCMAVWRGDPHDRLRHRVRDHQALIAAVLPYRPPAPIDPPAFIRYGRGKGGAPGIFSRGDGYLLTAGGAFRGMIQRVVPRPITLMIDDDAIDLRDCIRIRGDGPFHQWNNTGVHRDFACGDAPVIVPDRFEPIAEDDTWRIYQPMPDRPLRVAIHNADGLGVMTLFPDGDITLEQLHSANPDPAASLRHTFKRPDGRSLRYKVDARAGRWVITHVDGEPTPRDYDTWPDFRDAL